MENTMFVESTGFYVAIADKGRRWHSIKGHLHHKQTTIAMTAASAAKAFPSWLSLSRSIEDKISEWFAHLWAKSRTTQS